MMKFKTQVIPFFLLLTLAFSCQEMKKDQQGETGQKAGMEITDKTITQAIENELLEHPEVPGHLIDVNTFDGIARLSGSTDNILSKERAEEIAATVKGVEGVVNKIDVKTILISDDELENRVESALYFDPVTDEYEIGVEVNEKKVTLTGEVDSWQEKQIASEVAKAVTGVEAVDNNLAFLIDEERPDVEIHKEIERLLLIDVRVDGEMIDTEVKNGTVILSGEVGSLAEKSRAIADAWVAGVDSVNAEKLEVKKWAREPMYREGKYIDKNDKQIKKDVKQMFKYDYRVNPFDIEIEVDDGYVTLSGKVDNLMAKNKAGKRAEQVVGVWGVENKIKVRPQHTPTGKVLSERVETKLAKDPYLNRYNLNEKIYNQKVYLKGRVRSYFEKQRAEDIISSVPGVVDVQNDIEIIKELNKYGPVISSADLPGDEKIKEEIEEQLWWSPFVNENEVQVEVDDGHVTLTGEVDTRLEKEYAAKNAFQGGAFTLENLIKVEFLPSGEDEDDSFGQVE